MLRGQGFGVFVEVDGSGSGKGGSLRRGYGESSESGGLKDLRGRLRIHKKRSVGWNGRNKFGETRTVVKSWNLKESGNRLRDATGPEAIKVNVRLEMESLGCKAMVVGGRVGRMVLALKRISKDDDELCGGIGVDSQVEIASGHFVDFINN